jgi:hypothetical protein
MGLCALACYRHIAVALKAGVMPEAEGCNADQSAAEVNTHSFYCSYFASCLRTLAARRRTALRSGPTIRTRLTSIYLQTEMQSASLPYPAA